MPSFCRIGRKKMYVSVEHRVFSPCMLVRIRPYIFFYHLPFFSYNYLKYCHFWDFDFKICIFSKLYSFYIFVVKLQSKITIFIVKKKVWSVAFKIPSLQMLYHGTVHMIPTTHGTATENICSSTSHKMCT